jgi:hypothetical protein
MLSALGGFANTLSNKLFAYVWIHTESGKCNLLEDQVIAIRRRSIT